MKTQLWTYRTGPLDRLLRRSTLSGAAAVARAALPHPPGDLLRRVARVAEVPYLLRVWSRAAAEAARGLGPAALPQVLACMTHWTQGPACLEPWEWVVRLQVAAALVASHVGEGPWASSPRREAVEDVAEGPADWASTAAIIALLDVARRDEVARATALAALHRCARRPFNATLWQHAVEPALHALHELGALEPDEARLLEESQA